MKLRSIWLVLITLNMVSPALADDGDPEKPQKHGVRVVNLKGVYADHPAPPGLDPMALPVARRRSGLEDHRRFVRVGHDDAIDADHDMA